DLADVFSIDTRNPVVLSIFRDNASPTNAANVSWTVTFSEPVTGVAVGNFLLFNGGLSGTPAITGVTGSSATYSVSASTGSGEGTLSLYVFDPAGITDAAGNPPAALPVQ